jgi:hypothetical protein
MGIEKLLKQLQEYLNKEEKKKVAHCDRIDRLLEKLEEKKKKLEKKLAAESNSTKQKRLLTDLKVVKLQLKNGHKRREELSEKCK